MVAYYNEIDPFAAQWLRNLIAAGEIAPGDVDERSIKDVKADDLKRYTQCHFFAGIGGWSLALRLAGWDDTRPVWTGSCPCQPFSAAGGQKGHGDERHLWPDWYRLLRESKPRTIFGEQVAGAIAFGWLDEVFNDLEAQAYSCAASILPACSVGAGHRRDRIWFVADTEYEQRQITKRNGCHAIDPRQPEAEWAKGTGVPAGCSGFLADAIGDDIEAGSERIRRETRSDAVGCRPHAAMDDTHNYIHAGTQPRGRTEEEGLSSVDRPENCSGREFGRTGSFVMGDTCITRLEGFPRDENDWLKSRWDEAQQDGSVAPADTIRSATGWISCPDGKIRPVEPGICLLAHGVSGRVVVRMPELLSKEDEKKEPQLLEHWYYRAGALKGFGNAIVPTVGAQFINAFMEVIGE